MWTPLPFVYAYITSITEIILIGPSSNYTEQDPDAGALKCPEHVGHTSCDKLHVCGEIPARFVRVLLCGRL